MTLDGMRVYDIRRGLQVLRQRCPKLKKLTVTAGDGAESLVLLASLFEPAVHQIVVPNLPVEQSDLPSILNLSRSMPATLLPVVAARHNTIVVNGSKADYGELSSVVSDADWTGKTVRFTAK